MGPKVNRSSDSCNVRRLQSWELPTERAQTEAENKRKAIPGGNHEPKKAFFAYREDGSVVTFIHAVDWYDSIHRKGLLEQPPGSTKETEETDNKKISEEEISEIAGTELTELIEGAEPLPARAF